MTPMIDMTFQLIAFFMVLINFSEVEQDQRITLPASELAQPPEVAYDEPRTIQILRPDPANGIDEATILFNRELLDLDGLLVALKTEANVIRAFEDATLSDVTVVIRADASIKSGLVQEIIQTCQEAEFDTFALRGRQSDSSTLLIEN